MVMASCLMVFYLQSYQLSIAFPILPGGFETASVYKRNENRQRAKDVGYQIIL
jgi:hypothetical protein